MNSRERLLAVLRGQEIDRIPWAPFLAYWWEQCKDPEITSLGEAGFLKTAGADPLMRGKCCMFKTRYGKTKITESAAGIKKQVRYETPVGGLQAVYDFSDAGDTWFLTEHPVKTAEDFSVLAYIAQDMIVEADFGTYEGIAKEHPDALYVPLLSPYGKTSFQSLIEYWVGTEELSLLEADSPEAIVNALDAMRRPAMETVRISASSSAEAFISWEDTSTTNISPRWYESYILPEINAWCDVLHAAGKMYIQHACGHLRHLASLIASSKIDAVESLSDPPTGNISVEDFSKLLPERIAIIGGIEPTFFMNSSIDELEKRVDFLCGYFQGKRFILANADSCPPSVGGEKFGVVARRVCRNFNMTPPVISAFGKTDCN